MWSKKGMLNHTSLGKYIWLPTDTRSMRPYHVFIKSSNLNWQLSQSNAKIWDKAGTHTSSKVGKNLSKMKINILFRSFLNLLFFVIIEAKITKWLKAGMSKYIKQEEFIVIIIWNRCFIIIQIVFTQHIYIFCLMLIHLVT